MKRQDKKTVIAQSEAEHLLRFNTYIGQRNLSESHVEDLAEKMKDGRFHIGQIALIHLMDGSTLLMDGQHQLHAVLFAKTAVEVVLLDYFVEPADTKESIAEVFAQFNVDRPRGRADIAWIYGCQIGMDSWPRKCVTLCNTALGLLACGFAGGSQYLKKDENARLLSTHRNDCEFIHRIAFGVEQKLAKHLLRGPVAAAMISTFRVDEEDAEVFWSSVRDGDMLKHTDPAFTLRDYLLRVTLTSNHGSATKQSATNREIYGKCITAWNAYRRSLSTKLKFYRNKSLPDPK